jgi:hypothetical protein
MVTLVRINDYVEGGNFWVINPEFTTLTPFDALYKGDKSKSKADTSKLMWAFYFKTSPYSIYYHLPNKDELIERDFIKDKNFKWDKYKKETDTFEELTTTEAERAFIGWEEKMRERREFLRESAYSEETWEMNDKMMAATAKMFADLAKIKNDLEEEVVKHNKGNKVKSLSENNEI